MKIAITGANGFVGRATLSAAVRRGHQPVPIVRRPHGLSGEVVAGDLSERSVPLSAILGADAIIHLSARTHSMNDRREDAGELYHRANVVATQRVVRSAKAAGIKRFVFMSSIKAVGEWSTAGEPLSPDTRPRPEDDYGRSKLAAEQVVRNECESANIDWVIIRPPLVHGAGAKGNLHLLARLVRSGIPLPFGSVRNRRSIISVINLADAAVLACVAPGTSRRVLHLADLTVSTPDLIRAIGASLGRPASLFPFPASLMAAAAALVGRKGLADRLLGSLELDTAESIAALGWSFAISPECALGQTLIDPRKPGGGGKNAAIPLRRKVLQRALDIGVALALAPIAIPICVLLCAIIRLETPGAPLFAQTRVGRFEKPFRLFKLRTMYADTGDRASHLVDRKRITPFGAILRRTKLDELPQLLNILNGSMSLIGPRPCLPGQTELIEERRKRGLFSIRPGITGAAQVAGIDMSDPKALVLAEEQGAANRSFTNDIRLLIKTASGSGRGDAVSLARPDQLNPP